MHIGKHPENKRDKSSTIIVDQFSIDTWINLILSIPPDPVITEHIIIKHGNFIGNKGYKKCF